jgi:hypothetical protein
MSVQTPFVQVDVPVCWQSAAFPQSCAWVVSQASTHSGIPTPPSAPHVWQHEEGSPHIGMPPSLNMPHGTPAASWSSELDVELELAAVATLVLDDPPPRFVVFPS